MLAITGHFQGRQYDNEVVPAQHLIQELFPTELSFLNPIEHKIEFRVSSGRSKVHRGQSVSPPATQIPASFTASINGETITLRYFESSRPSENGRNLDYAPRKLTLEWTGGRLAFSPQGAQRDLEKVVYYCLHPNCATSPFKTKSSRVSYLRHDAVGEAESRIRTVRRTNAIVQSVISGEVEAFDLLNAAAGMGVSTQQPLLIIQDQMISMATDNPNGFADKFANPAIQLAGMVRRLIEHKVLERETNGAQVTYQVNPTAVAEIGEPAFMLNLKGQADDRQAKAALINLLSQDEEARSILELALRARTGQVKKAEAAPAKKAKATEAAEAVTAPEPEMAMAGEEAPEPVIKSKTSRRRKSKAKS